jgi:isopenicillin N synthase-like dioxygenase
MRLIDMSRQLTVLDFSDFIGEDDTLKQQFVEDCGAALQDIGFFALKNHGIALSQVEQCYQQAESFFALEEDSKMKYLLPQIAHQRGYTAFGIENAKGNLAPDLKEFWQNGRSHIEGKPAPTYPQNVWPHEEIPQFEAAVDGLFLQMELLSRSILQSCSFYLGKDANWLGEMAEEGNTIMRVIHYPPLGDNAPIGAVRSAAHEDINFITLLVTATADGLEVMDHDGTWIKVEGNAEYIIVDSGDMLQNLTNGLFKSTTHRVVNPSSNSVRRFSMPLFVHPRNEIDLTPQAEFIAKTGGKALYPSIKAGDYLHKRLVEIGLIKE